MLVRPQHDPLPTCISVAAVEQGALMVNDDELLQGMMRCRQLGALPQVHAENGEAVALGQQLVFDAGKQCTVWWFVSDLRVSVQHAIVSSQAATPQMSW